MKKVFSVLIIMLFSLITFSQVHSAKNPLTYAEFKNTAPIIADQTFYSYPIPGIFEVGSLYAKDFENDELTFEIIMQSQNYFTIVGNTLYYTHDEIITNTFYLLVRVTDGYQHPLWSEAVITVHIDY